MHEEVSVVIPGAKNKEQLIQNISASSVSSIDNLMGKIQDIYNKHLKDDIHDRW